MIRLIKKIKSLGWRFFGLPVALVAFWGISVLIMPTVPRDAVDRGETPRLYPDYDGCVVPANIAPLNFEILETEGADREWLVEIEGSTGEGGRIALRGKTVKIPTRRWRRLLKANEGASIVAHIYRQGEDRDWKARGGFAVEVAAEKVDRWAHYRLIEPSYEYGNVLALKSRDLTSFDERTLATNESFGQKPCLNCHNFQDRDGKRFLFHYRDVDFPEYSGTVFVDGKRVEKRVLTASDELTCAYPAWRPTGPFVAFSENKTRQIFHTVDTKKVDVFDIESRLAIYNVETGELIENKTSKDRFDTFPSWSPDGEYLYFCTATVALKGEGDDARAKDAQARIKEFKYDIARSKFDATTGRLGAPEIVVDAASIGRSAIHPRVSPGGKFLVSTQCDYGTFPIWHKESDLMICDLGTGETRPLDALNSPYAESYHSWDSSGRWLLFSSRRGDGHFTRLWLAHVDAEGVAAKPFPLPQGNPASDRTLLKSYNVPELTRNRPTVSGRKLARF